MFTSSAVFPDLPLWRDDEERERAYAAAERAWYIRERWRYRQVLATARARRRLNRWEDAQACGGVLKPHFDAFRLIHPHPSGNVFV
jgi:hypothetical protein